MCEYVWVLLGYFFFSRKRPRWVESSRHVTHVRASLWAKCVSLTARSSTLSKWRNYLYKNYENILANSKWVGTGIMKDNSLRSHCFNSTFCLYDNFDFDWLGVLTGVLTYINVRLIYVTIFILIAHPQGLA